MACLSDLVNSWKQQGSVYLWRYRDNARNYPGWNMHCDREASASLVDLLTALQSCTGVRYRTIRVSPPTPGVLAVPNNRGGAARWWAPARWRIEFDPELGGPDAWSFSPDEDPAALRLGARYLPDFQRGVLDMMRGRGDYSIGAEGASPDESEVLWFWW